jgi:hypothetical protein
MGISTQPRDASMQQPTGLHGARLVTLAMGLNGRAGQKDDEGKDPWDLLPIAAVRKVVGVLAFGARKYAPDGWRQVPDRRRRYYAAALRHLTAWWEGEAVDTESGHNHLAHAACCVLFLLAEEP